MWKLSLSHTDGEPLYVHPMDADDHVAVPLLGVVTMAEAHGKFKSVDGTSAATTIVTAPSNDGSITVTDIILSAEKKNGGTVTLQFTDGVNTEIIFKAPVTDAQIALAIPIKGCMCGWKDARLEVVTVTDFIYSVTAGYYKQKTGVDYPEWDALR